MNSTTDHNIYVRALRDVDVFLQVIRVAPDYFEIWNSKDVMLTEGDHYHVLRRLKGIVREYGADWIVGEYIEAQEDELRDLRDPVHSR